MGKLLRRPEGLGNNAVRGMEEKKKYGELLERGRKETVGHSQGVRSWLELGFTVTYIVDIEL